MTAEKNSKTDPVAEAVEEIEKAAAEASTKKKPAAKAKPADEVKKAAPKKATTKKAAPKKAATKKAAPKQTSGDTEKAAEKKAAPKPKKKPAKKAKSQQLKITQVKSQIGFDSRQRKVLAGLGLGRIGKEVVRIDDPCIRGMVAKVSHLVSVEEVEA